MLRELIWITFAGLVLMAPAAEASHVLRHNAEYCDGLVAMAEQATFLKAFGVDKVRFVEYVRDVGVKYDYAPEVVALWVEDAAALYDAADDGEAHVLACYKALQQPSPTQI